MDTDEQIERLRDLMENPKANMSEITNIYWNIFKQEASVASNGMRFLQESAVHLLSPELTTILRKCQLEAFSYLLVANSLLEVDDVKDDLEHGDALGTINPPAITIRRLRQELGVAPRDAAAMPAAAPANAAIPAQLDQQQVPAGIAMPLNQEATLLSDENSLAIKIKNQCTSIKIVNRMTVYKLPLKTSSTFRGASSIVRRFSFGEPDPSGSKPCKTILLMGATGSGKTTMINAMINYVLGVQWNDPFRFMLIEEEETRSQALSYTSDVTAYDIHHRNGFRIDYSLTIIDTPGFGDTHGIERDQQITAVIKQLFEHKNGIQALDTVGFVVQASLARLTPSQNYIFNSVLSIFGKDIGENVRFLVTFADGAPPLVLAAIKVANLPCPMDFYNEPCHQSFSNNVIYVSNQTHDCRNLPNWDNTMKNYQSFFSELSKMTAKSLQLTKEVLNGRQCLQITIQCLETTIQEHFMKIEELRETEEIIALNKDVVNANKNFEVTVKVLKKKKVEIQTGQTALNCQKCEITCHYPSHPNSVLVPPAFRKPLWKLSIRSSFLSKANCNICPGKCEYCDHEDERTRWVYVPEDETRTSYDIRKKYDEAMEKTLNAEELMNALQGEAEKLKLDIIKAMDQITHYSNLLKEIAMRGDPLSTPGYIDMMIENEKMCKKPGHFERIKSLEDLLKKVQLTEKVTDGGDLAKQFQK